jgi:DNA-binding GntR family transcriptional regulator
VLEDIEMTENSAGENGRIDAADLVHERVRKEIIDGTLAPGERLTETHIAERFDVSRTPVREALVRLQADGFVELVRNRGAFVSKWTEDDLEEIFGLRIMLEGYGARIGAGKIGPDEIASLEALADEMDEALQRPRRRRRSAAPHSTPTSTPAWWGPPTTNG